MERGPSNVRRLFDVDAIAGQPAEPHIAAGTNEERFVLCTFGPPNERKRHWILKFEDTDVGDMHFDNELTALMAFRSFAMTYTCTLFVTADDGKKD